MSVRHGVDPPRRLLTLFVAVMVAIAAALGGLGWHLLNQDRDLSRQRIQERLEGAADLASAILVRKVSEAENLLTTAPAEEPKSVDALTLTFTTDNIEAKPAARLIYYPFVSEVRGFETSMFGAGEAAEFHEHNYAKAVAAFRELARSTNPAVRAGALLRLARNLRRSGAVPEALAAYDELIRLGAVPVEGLPADLAGRYARLLILREAGPSVVCEREAGALYNDLLRGRWHLTRGQWEFYNAETRQCFHPSAGLEAREKDASALAGGVEWLWQAWQRNRSSEARSSGRNILRIDDSPVIVLWQSTPDRFVGFAGGRAFIEGEWGAALRTIEERHSARFTLIDAEGHRVLGNDEAAPTQIVRSLTDAQIPWTLRTRSADPGADLAHITTRRHLLLAGLGLAGLLIFTGGYFITRALRRELEVARLQSDFVAAVSHEFRTPLASIRQASELLADGRVSSEQRRQAYYEALRAESERLQRLVENLLNFGRMEAGAEEYRFEALEPGTLVNDIAEEFGEKVREKGYCLETDAGSRLPSIRGDREALGVAVWNLLDNAVKYSPDSRRVWIETGQEGNEVAIRVRDQGVGIAASEQKEIFKKFVRSGAAKAAGIKGTGLGLAMAERIVSAHGGRIRLASQPGAGSTFTILLPVENENGIKADS